MKRLGLICAAMLALGTTGCENEQWVEFKVLTELPPNGSFESDAVHITAGFAVGVKAIPIQNNRRTEDVIDLVVNNASVLGLDRGLEANQFVFFGVDPGNVTIDIYFGDELIGDMPATVLQQK